MRIERNTRKQPTLYTNPLDSRLRIFPHRVSTSGFWLLRQAYFSNFENSMSTSAGKSSYVILWLMLDRPTSYKLNEKILAENVCQTNRSKQLFRPMFMAQWYSMLTIFIMKSDWELWQGIYSACVYMKKNIFGGIWREYFLP